ncbi:hypothetical protein [Streptomyces sp. NPDC097610]|uniref:hypothetical protein n=1 Tax=Streptomyces sp. NPDC097610 TaxID=3157227 RepID=UPI00333311DE
MWAVFAAITGAVLAALLSIFTASFQDWRQRRSEGVQRSQAIADALRYFELIDRWLAVHESVSNKPDYEKAKAWAAHTMQQAVAEIPDPTDRTSTPTAEREWKVVRQVFLLFKPKSRAEAITQTLFYVTVGCTVVLFGLHMGMTTSWPKRLERSLGTLIILGPWVILFHYIATFLRRRKVDQKET